MSTTLSEGEVEVGGAPDPTGQATQTIAEL